MRGRPLPFDRGRRDPARRCPPPTELWAWAHVHVNRALSAGDRDDVDRHGRRAAAARRRARREPRPAPTRGSSARAGSSPNTAYHAFLVPTFETRPAGRARAATRPARRRHAVAPGSDYADRPEPELYPVLLPLVLPHRRRVGDFEYLVRLLKPRTVDPRVGRRDIDVHEPGAGPARRSPTRQLGGVLRLGGALRVPLATLERTRTSAEYSGSRSGTQPYPHPFQTRARRAGQPRRRLRDQSAAATANPRPACDPAIAGDPDPLIVPPLYGRWHAQASQLLPERDGTPSPDDNWVHELNLDPAVPRRGRARHAASCSRTRRRTWRPPGSRSARCSRRTRGSGSRSMAHSSPRSSGTAATIGVAAGADGRRLLASPRRCTGACSPTARRSATRCAQSLVPPTLRRHDGAQALRPRGRDQRLPASTPTRRGDDGLIAA